MTERPKLYAWVNLSGETWTIRAPSLTVHIHRSVYDDGDNQGRWYVSCFNIDLSDVPLEARDIREARREGLARVLRVLEDNYGDIKRLLGVT